MTYTIVTCALCRHTGSARYMDYVRSGIVMEGPDRGWHPGYIRCTGRIACARRQRKLEASA